MGRDAVELVDQISLACRDHLTLESHLYIARGVRASVAIDLSCLLAVGNLISDANMTLCWSAVCKASAVVRVEHDC